MTSESEELEGVDDYTDMERGDSPKHSNYGDDREEYDAFDIMQSMSGSGCIQ